MFFALLVYATLICAKDRDVCENNMGQYEVKLIRTEEGLKDLAADWIQLHELVHPRNPFFSYEWSIIYWENLCPPSTPFLLTVWSQDTLVGLLPLRLEKKWGFRLLRFLGDGRADYLGFLVSSDHAPVYSILTDSLYQSAAEWDCIFFRKLPVDYAAHSLAFDRDGFRIIQVKSGVAPYLSFSGDWEELRANGPSQLREAQRKLKRFKREGGTVVRIEDYDYELLATQIKFIESNSWKEGTDIGKFQTKKEQTMLKQCLATFEPRNEIEVWMATMELEPAAFLINFLTPERTCFYQTAYHEKYQKYSPGTILCLLAIERTWRQGRREFDFMDGPEPFKKRWANNEQELKKMVIFPKNLRGYLALMALAISRAYHKYFPARQGGLDL